MGECGVVAGGSELPVGVNDLVVVLAGRALDAYARFNETNSATENGQDEHTPILMFHKREWDKQVHLMYARVLRFSRTATRQAPRPRLTPLTQAPCRFARRQGVGNAAPS